LRADRINEHRLWMVFIHVDEREPEPSSIVPAHVFPTISSPAQNAFASEEAQVAAARANLRQAERNLGYTKVYAPVDGYLTNAER
jgi:hypothetical protein